MKAIKINITKAVIESFSVELEDEKPEVSITIGLYTDGGKKIAGYSISTSSWNEASKFELPVGIIPPILEIMRELEAIATRHCNKGQKALGGGN